MAPVWVPCFLRCGGRAVFVYYSWQSSFSDFSISPYLLDGGVLGGLLESIVGNDV